MHLLDDNEGEFIQSSLSNKARQNIGAMASTMMWVAVMILVVSGLTLFWMVSQFLQTIQFYSNFGMSFPASLWIPFFIQIVITTVIVYMQVVLIKTSINFSRLSKTQEALHFEEAMRQHQRYWMIAGISLLVSFVLFILLFLFLITQMSRLI